MITRLLAGAALTATYAAIVESFAWGDLVTGAIISAAALALAPPWRAGDSPALPLGRRIVAAVPFLAVVAVESVRGTLAMSAFVLGLRALPESGLVEIPIGGRSDLGVVVSAWALTLSPGSALIEIGRDRGVMVFHFADAGDPDAIRRRQADLYERYQRHVFP